MGRKQQQIRAPKREGAQGGKTPETGARRRTPARTSVPGRTDDSTHPSSSFYFQPGFLGSAAPARSLVPHVSRLSTGTPEIQAALTVGPSDDPYEREADRVAEQVVSMPAPGGPSGEPLEEEELPAPGGAVPTSMIQRVCNECERDQDGEQSGRVQRAVGTAGKAGGRVSDKLPGDVARARSGGQALGARERGYFEPRFGRDLSSVRLHTGPEAERSASELGARAYTLGSDVVFGAAQYRPDTHEGRTVLAHELTHVIQQGGAGRNPSRSSPSGRIQRVVYIDDIPLQSMQATKDALVNDYLKDFIADEDDRFIFSSRYIKELIYSLVDDMQRVTTRLDHDAMEDFAQDVQRRAATSMYMRQSQGSERTLMGFSYPNRRSDKTVGCDPKVNDAVTYHWEEAQVRGEADYYFELSPKGKADAYEAVIGLFKEHSDENACKRTLIHCDHLVSLIHVRAYVEATGPKEFNELVGKGDIELVLHARGFLDLREELPGGWPGMPDGGAPLQEVRLSDPADLIIGDHVVFYNHQSYDALTEEVPSIWRFENAIVIDTKGPGGQNRYQGHGYPSPVVADIMLAGMVRQYNRHVSDILAITNTIDRSSPGSPARKAADAELAKKYPNVKRKGSGSGWEVKGKGLCDGIATRDLKFLTPAEAPGLRDPCAPPPNNIAVLRPGESRSE